MGMQTKENIDELVDKKVNHFIYIVKQIGPERKNEILKKFEKRGFARFTGRNLLNGNFKDCDFETVKAFSEIEKIPFDVLFDIDNTPKSFFFVYRQTLAMGFKELDKDNKILNDLTDFVTITISEDSENYGSILNRHIKMMRDCNNMTLNDLADKMGINTARLTPKRISSSVFRLKNMLRMTIIFDCSLDYLVGSKNKILSDAATNSYYIQLLELSNEEIMQFMMCRFPVNGSHPLEARYNIDKWLETN